MDNLVREALTILGFLDTASLPKLKEIRKKYMELSLIHHPDRNGGSKEATENFQKILNAYHTAGRACENTVYADDDDEDKLPVKCSSSSASPQSRRT